jgi:predicted HTH domain antitoxin
MNDATFEVHIPSNLLEFGLDKEQVQQNINGWLVLSLFTDGQISSGKAARLLDITRIEFLTLLRKRGIAYVDYSAEELKEEIDTVNALKLS